LDTSNFSSHVWTYTVLASGLGWLWVAGRMAVLQQRPHARGPYAWLGLYAAVRGLLAWFAPLAAAPGPATFLAAVDLALLVPAVILTRDAWKSTATLPWNVRMPFRLAAVMLLIDACLAALLVPGEALLPTWWPNRSALPGLVGCPFELIATLCVAVLLAALEWHRQSQLEPRPTFARRWGHLAALVLVAAVLWPITGRAQSTAPAAAAGPSAGAGATQATPADSPDKWGRLAAERLWAGLPLLAMLLLLAAGLATAHIVQSREAKRRLAARRHPIS
jgi:hypothetical protein